MVGMDGITMNEIIATYSPCCKLLREGDARPDIMHNGACRKRHNGVLGPTIKLIATVDSANELYMYRQSHKEKDE